MKYINIIVCCIALGGCATRGLWEPDNKNGFIIKNDGTETVNIRQTGKQIQISSQTVGIKDLELDSQIGDFKVEKVEMTRCLNSETKYEIQLAEGNRCLGIMAKIINEVQYEKSYEGNLIKFSELPVPRYDAERVVGRVVLTPFAVATDVVIVATAVIWYPVMAVVLGSKTR